MHGPIFEITVEVLNLKYDMTHVTERWDVIAGHKLTLKSLVHIPAEEEENQQVDRHTTYPL